MTGLGLAIMAVFMLSGLIVWAMTLLADDDDEERESRDDGLF